jgi:hypothetical protein
LPAADQAFAEAEAAQDPRVDNFAAEITRLRARLAFELADLARAESLNEVDRAQSGAGASYHELRAALLWRRGERDRAADAARACLAIMPGNPIAQAILDSVRLGIGGPMAWREEPEPATPKRP